MAFHLSSFWFVHECVLSFFRFCSVGWFRPFSFEFLHRKEHKKVCIFIFIFLAAAVIVAGFFKFLPVCSHAIMVDAGRI